MVPAPPDETIFGGGHNWIEKLDNFTDFSLLRMLVLAQAVSQADLVSSKRACLPQLTTLSLTCELASPATVEDGLIASRSDYFGGIETFLSGMPSLTALQVTGWDDAQHVFSFENANFERLSFIPVENLVGFNLWTIICEMQQHLTLDGLAVLASSFPRLTDLSVPVKRSRGDSAEAAVYRYIGEHFRNLRRLSLSLDCSPPSLVWNSPTGSLDTPFPRPYRCGPGWPATSADLNRDRNEYAFRERWDKKRCYRNGHIYDVLVNTALDASLARKIYAARTVSARTRLLIIVNHPEDNTFRFSPPSSLMSAFAWTATTGRPERGPLSLGSREGQFPVEIPDECSPYPGLRACLLTRLELGTAVEPARSSVLCIRKTGRRPWFRCSSKTHTFAWRMPLPMADRLEPELSTARTISADTRSSRFMFCSTRAQNTSSFLPGFGALN
ncbi:hypothetical protein VTK26DRAFT_8937 [Humicola hyalothermophila]